MAVAKAAVVSTGEAMSVLTFARAPMMHATMGRVSAVAGGLGVDEPTGQQDPCQEQGVFEEFLGF